MTFIPSENQLRIFNFIKNEKGNAIINAVAGSGKTTTLVESIKLLSGKNNLFLAFNKSIKEELQKRVNNMGINIDVNTYHGHGYSIILKNNKGNVTIDNYKYRKLLKSCDKYNKTNDENLLNVLNIKNINGYLDKISKIKLFGETNKDIEESEENILKLCGLIRSYLVTDQSEIEELVEKYAINVNKTEIKTTIELINLGEEITNVIDFTDMVYLPVKLGMSFTQYDTILIDEVQDTNAIQRELMVRSLKLDGRFIGVGDKKQAIYGFSGADHESFDKLTQLPNTTILPLSETYRCGVNIINTIKNIVPEITPHKNNKPGFVNYKGKLSDIKKGDLVICRNTYPLVKLCIKLNMENIKCFILGGDIGKTIVKLITDTNQVEIDKAITVLYSKLETLLCKIMDKKGITEDKAKMNQEYVNYEEKLKLIEAIYSNIKNETNNVSDICGKILEMFDDNGDGIMLSTIHKVKGLEADVVHIIHPELIPSKNANEDWEIEQEYNLKYVAHTRAKRVLSFITDFDANSNSENETMANKLVDVKVSKHIGSIGSKIIIDGAIKEIKEYNNVKIYTIEDKNGNLFEKWGVIPIVNVLSKFKTVNIGTPIKGVFKVTKHISFANVDKTRVS